MKLKWLTSEFCQTKMTKNDICHIYIYIYEAVSLTLGVRQKAYTKFQPFNLNDLTVQIIST